MVGLELPPALGRGKPAKEALEPWMALVEELMGRGVRTPSELRKILGVGYRTANNWMAAVRKRWTSGLSDDLINWRRETLYGEADAVARAAWVESRLADTPSEKASLFKVVLMANQRKAALTGLDGLEIKIKKEITQTTMVDLVARVETQHNLAPGALEAIGRNAARALSGGLVTDATRILEEGGGGASLSMTPRKTAVDSDPIDVTEDVAQEAKAMLEDPP
jgi:hypothetical protein